MEKPKPIFRKGMAKQLLIIADNGMDLFIEEGGQYRTPTEEEYEAVRATGIKTNDMPTSRFTPFPKSQ